MIYAFEPFELDLDRFELRRGGQPLALEPRAFDLLRLLIEQRGGVVTKSEILNRVWRQEHVCEGSIHRAINRLRGALGQRSRSSGPIETVHRRGYRFAATVHVASTPETSLRDASAAPTPASPSADGPFVGREDVFERLCTNLAQARAGQTQLCVLTGEAGIGKTRCTRELERFARLQGASVWRVTCSAGASEPPLWPWLEILRLCAAEEERSAAFGVELRDVLDELAESLSDSEVETLDYQDAFPLLDRIARTVIRAGEWRVRVLVIDDLHHMQNSALRVLGLMAATPTRSRVLVLATLRDGRPRDENLASATLSRLLRHSERIPLRALTPEELAQYVTASELPCSDELTEALHAKTRGNPFFLREMIHLLISRHGRAGLASLRGDELGVPDAVREVMRERVATLDDVARKLLGFASAIGEHFEVPLLIEASGVNGSEALSALDQALGQRLIEQRKDFGGYRFSHGLIADTLYDDLSAVERSQIHHAIATTLERRPPRHLQALALHFHHALPLGDPLKAMSYCRRAAGSAAGKRAYDESPRLLRWALEAERFAANPDPERHARWTLDLARSHFSVGDVRRGRLAVTEVIDQASSHRLGDALAEAALLLRPTVEIAWREDPLLLRAMHEARTYLRPEHEKLRLRVLCCMASTPPAVWDAEQSLQIVEQALTDARKLGDSRTIFDALRAKAYLLLVPDRLRESLAVTAEILSLGNAQTMQLIAAEAHRMRYTALLVLGQLAEAEQSLELSREISERRPMPAVRLGHERRLVARELRMGLLDAARQRLATTASEAERRGLSYSRLLSWRAEIELERAQRREGVAECIAVPPPDLNHMPELQAIHARSLLEAGRHEEARQILVRLSAEEFACLPLRSSRLAALASLSVVAVGIGDQERSRVLYALLRRYERLFAVDMLGFSMGSVQQYLGRLAAVLGRCECAELHLQAARSENLRTDHRVALAETEAAWAELKSSL